MRSKAVLLLSSALLLAATRLAFAGSPPPEPRRPEPPTLGSLLALFRAAPGVEAKFREQKFMALLMAPLEAEGVLYFTRPGLLARYTTKPRQTFQIVDPQRVRFGDDTKTEILDLTTKPQVKVFVESFTLLLSGDEAALGKTYLFDFVGALPERPDTWRLRLVPKTAPLDKVFSSIVLEGQGIVLTEMRMSEVGGDETVTTFSAVTTQRSFGEDEKRRLFRLDP